MKPIEIVELIKQANPDLLGKTPNQKAAKIISAALSVLSKQLIETTVGIVKVPGLGAFAVKQVEREKDGEKKTVKRIAFRTPKAKVKKA
ncbi:MAG: hypothetical protein Q8N96_06820, partial [Methylovulum sp.]|nr:hypothetical protein [Methylovulum sp.]